MPLILYINVEVFSANYDKHIKQELELLEKQGLTNRKLKLKI